MKLTVPVPGCQSLKATEDWFIHPEYVFSRNGGTSSFQKPGPGGVQRIVYSYSKDWFPVKIVSLEAIGFLTPGVWTTMEGTGQAVALVGG